MGDDYDGFSSSAFLGATSNDRGYVHAADEHLFAVCAVEEVSMGVPVLTGAGLTLGGIGLSRIAVTRICTYVS